MGQQNADQHLWLLQPHLCPASRTNQQESDQSLDIRIHVSHDVMTMMVNNALHIHSEEFQIGVGSGTVVTHMTLIKAR